MYGRHTQSARPWKYINYVSDRAGAEMKWDIRMLDIDHPRDASHAAFKRVVEHIRYEHPNHPAKATENVSLSM